MYTQFVEPEFGKNKLVDLKRTDVRGFYNYLADERHVKVNTIDNIHTVLHQVLELGVEDDYLRYNPSNNALKELKWQHVAFAKLFQRARLVETVLLSVIPTLERRLEAYLSWER